VDIKIDNIEIVVFGITTVSMFCSSANPNQSAGPTEEYLGLLQH
jgi:hypothetical protein